jgi:hypothetical protein
LGAGIAGQRVGECRAGDVLDAVRLSPAASPPVLTLVVRLTVTALALAE